DRHIHLAEADLVVALARREDVQPLEECQRRRAVGGRRGARRREKRGVGGRREDREIAKLLIVIAEDKHLVLLDRAARGEAELLPSLGGLLAVDQRNLRVDGLERLVPQEIKPFSAELIGSRFGDSVHRAAGGAAELRG